MPIRPVLKVFLLGESGAGKTTLRAALARCIALADDSRWVVPRLNERDRPSNPGQRTRGGELQLDAAVGLTSAATWLTGPGVVAGLALVLALAMNQALVLAQALAMNQALVLAQVVSVCLLLVVLYNHASANGSANRLLLWDGGQAAFSMSHRYSLGATNAAFVLVLSLSDRESGEYRLNEVLLAHMKHWLAVVCGATDHKCPPNSVVYERPPVYLVFSRADTLQEKGLAQAQAVLVQDEAVRLFGDRLLILDGGVLDCRKSWQVKSLVDALEQHRKALAFPAEVLPSLVQPADGGVLTEEPELVHLAQYHALVELKGLRRLVGSWRANEQHATATMYANPFERLCDEVMARVMDLLRHSVQARFRAVSAESKHMMTRLHQGVLRKLHGHPRWLSVRADARHAAQMGASQALCLLHDLTCWTVGGLLRSVCQRWCRTSAASFTPS